MPRVSVLIPAYNTERFVAQAVASALAQTYRDREVIVVDDGSTDGTATALAPFLDRIAFIQQPHAGASAARNRALREAHGAYIAFLDADDWWEPHRLATMLDYLGRNPNIGFATSDAWLIRDEEISKETFYGALPRAWRWRDNDQATWITRSNFIFAMVVARRELFDRHGTFDTSLRACVDWELWIRFLAGGERAGLVPEPLGFYRVRTGTLSHDRAALIPDMERILARLRATERYDLVSSLSSRIKLERGIAALRECETRKAASMLAAVAWDRGLPWYARLRALAGAALPWIAIRLYARR